MIPCHFCNKSAKVTARLSDDGKVYYWADICYDCANLSEEVTPEQFASSREENLDFAYSINS